MREDQWKHDHWMGCRYVFSTWQTMNIGNWGTSQLLIATRGGWTLTAGDRFPNVNSCFKKTWQNIISSVELKYHWNVPKIWCNSAFRPESNQQWSGPWPRPSPARLPSRMRTTSMVGTAPPRPTRPRGPRGATQPMGWWETPLSRGARPGWPSPWRSPRSPPGSRYIYSAKKVPRKLDPRTSDNITCAGWPRWFDKGGGHGCEHWHLPLPSLFNKEDEDVDKDLNPVIGPFVSLSASSALPLFWRLRLPKQSQVATNETDKVNLNFEVLTYKAYLKIEA